MARRIAIASGVTAAGAVAARSLAHPGAAQRAVVAGARAVAALPARPQTNRRGVTAAGPAAARSLAAPGAAIGIIVRAGAARTGLATAASGAQSAGATSAVRASAAV